MGYARKGSRHKARQIGRMEGACESGFMQCQSCIGRLARLDCSRAAKLIGAHPLVFVQPTWVFPNDTDGHGTMQTGGLMRCTSTGSNIR